MRALALAVLLAAPAVAQERPVVTCVRQEIVPGFEAWGRAAGTTLAPGAYAVLRLTPARQVAYALAPERAPAAGSFGGAFPLRIERAGTYRVALSAGAWIDVIDGGRRLASGPHTHGPACSGIGKIVDFALAPGTYTVQLSEAKADAINAMIVATP